MAAYAYTPSLVTRVSKKLWGFPGIALVFGSINITNYNQAKVEVVEISKAFRSGLTVISSGITSNGYDVVWDTVSKSFKCFYGAPSPAGTITLTVNGGAAGTAIGIDADANQFNLTKAAATGRTSTLPAAFAGAAAAAAVEVANDVNVGSLTFIALGVG